MKKFFLMAVLTVGSLSVFAQKTTVTTTTAHSEATFQYTQARMPQVSVEPLVKPLIVEVEVINGAPTFWEKKLSKHKVEVELDGKLENIYNYGIFLYTQDAKSDMILAATYNFYSNPQRTSEEDWYVLEIKGFPAKFTSWHSATTADYEWMKISNEKNQNFIYTKTK